jgi:hypothetical protein
MIEGVLSGLADARTHQGAPALRSPSRAGARLILHGNPRRPV